MSVRTLSFVPLILPQIRLQTIFRKIETKRRCCTYYNDPTVMSKSVGYGFYYMVTIAMYWVFMRF